MHIYYSTGGYKNSNVEEVVKNLIDNGIYQIELSGTNYVKDNIKILSKFKNKVKFQIHNYFPPPKIPFVLNLASLDNEIYLKTLEHIYKTLESCETLGASYYSFHAGFLCDIQTKELGKKIKKKELQDRSESISLFTERVLKVADKAKKYGINIMIENNVISKNNLIEFNANPLLMCEADECLSIINNTPENINLLVDVAHLKVSAKTLNFNPETFLEKCNNITEGYHLSDNNGLADTNEKFDDKSWFWNKIKKSLKYYSIEVYGLDFSEISKLHLLAKNKLAS
jgi:sugar phosphate isomerase/epimerase